MLVLTRHRGQAIVIGDAQVTVVNIGHEKIRLRITAPRHIPVHRKEVYEAIRRKSTGRKPGDTIVRGLAPTAAEFDPPTAGSPQASARRVRLSLTR